MSLTDYIEKKRLEREKEVRNKIRKEKLSTFAKIITGAGLGASLGVLFAPKSGKETREDIANATKDGANYVVENVNNAVNAVKEKGLELKNTVNEKYEEFSNRNMTELSPESDEIFKEQKDETKDNSCCKE